MLPWPRDLITSNLETNLDTCRQQTITHSEPKNIPEAAVVVTGVLVGVDVVMAVVITVR